MQKTKRTYDVDAFILEALKIVKRSDEQGKVQPGDALRLEKKHIKTSRDVVLKLIDSLKKA